MQHLIANLRERKLDREDEGFTLIEMAIVIAVIAILIAVALPTFLGVQNSAHRSATVQQLTNSLTGAKSYYGTNSSSFGGIDMKALEPTITYLSPACVAAAAPQGQVSCAASTVAADNAQTIAFAGFDTGKNACIQAIDTYPSAAATPFLGGSGVWWTTTDPAVKPVNGTCKAVIPAAAPGAGVYGQTPPNG